MTAFDVFHPDGRRAAFVHATSWPSWLILRPPANDNGPHRRWCGDDLAVTIVTKRKLLRLRQRLRRHHFNRQGGMCCYCDVDMILMIWRSDDRPPDNLATLEHLRRKIDGGPDTIENTACACLSCNGERGELSPEEWRAIVQSRLIRYPVVSPVTLGSTNVR